MTDTVPVIAAPLFDPGANRIDMTLPHGLTLAEIVATALPEAVGDDLPIRVVLVTEKGAQAIARKNWQFVRPRAGVRVVIRVLPGKNALRSILQAVVAIAAIAIGAFFAPALAGVLGISAGLVQAGLTLGVTALGNLLINALVPPASPEALASPTDSDVKQSYSISGWKNRLAPDAPLPVPFGEHRYAPPFAARSYTEIVGDIQYIRGLFVFGPGPVSLSDFKIGTTDIEEYDEVEMEVREGLPGDDPVTLYPRQVLEDLAGSDLTRPLPRNDAGNVISGPSIEEPVVRYSAANGTGASVVVSFPGGLFNYDTSGNLQSLSVSIRIRYRAQDSGDPWTEVTTLNVSAAKREAFYRQHTWDFPARGRYEIEVTRMTSERTSSRVQDRSVLVAVQTMRPEYPINYPEPLAIVALRIKATYQLSGALDDLNALCKRVCLDWDSGSSTWIERATSNPASLYRWLLQSTVNAYPVPDSAIDFDQLADWHDYCAAKNLECNFVLDTDAAMLEILQLIAGAGRASPRHDGVKWSVVVDRPQDLVIDHINPRNSENFRWQRVFLDPPDAFRVPFFDKTNDYEPAERIVPWPGFAGEVTLTEEIELPGKTDPDEIWIEARRRQYELIHRPNAYSALQDGAARVATRGDLVMGSFDVLEQTQVAARVLSVEGQLVVLDQDVVMEAGEAYAIRFRSGLSEADTIGVSTVRTVKTVEGVSDAVVLSGSGVPPKAGDLVHFGKAVSESKALIIKGIEAGDNFTSHVTMIDASPIVDTLTDAETPPIWSGVVGSELNDPLLVPAAPVFTAVRTGFAGTGDPNGLDVLISQGSGSSAIVSTFEIDHRLTGTATWTTISISSGDGGSPISGYVSGNSVDLRARALTPNGTPGPYNTIAVVTIGDSDAALPMALGAGSGVAGDVAHADITIVTQNDDNVVEVIIYRLASGGVLDTGLHQIGAHAVSKSSTLVVVDGDSTGQDTSLLPAGDYDYYLEPQNQDDQAGPLAGPFTVTVT
ncbi:host specificity factor TipJ family phage tail protein [Roseibium sp. HPY-6]|uniref:host specificity factor TipJ family phage tail protein n=1 Tax=Roseibium sp. HPY-6 TaxID=3229852 RepID=UPI00338E1AE3